jgi:hypothetical protein
MACLIDRRILAVSARPAWHRLAEVCATGRAGSQRRSLLHGPTDGSTADWTPKPLTDQNPNCNGSHRSAQAPRGHGAFSVFRNPGKNGYEQYQRWYDADGIHDDLAASPLGLEGFADCHRQPLHRRQGAGTL